MNLSALSLKELNKSGMLKYYDDINPNIKNNLKRYTTSEYSSLNTLLKDGLNPANPQHQVSYPNEINWVNHLDKIMAAGPRVTQPFYIYWGTALPELITKRIKDQGYLNNLGYLSTNLDINTARKFAGDSCCLFQILVPQPQNIGYVSLKIAGEPLLLFQRGTNLRLIGKPYKYKYYPPKSNQYQLISMYVVSIHPGILVPTPIVSSRILEELDPHTKILTRFARYVEEMDTEDIGMLYNADTYPNEMVDEYIKIKSHDQINNHLKEIMINMVQQLI